MFTENFWKIKKFFFRKFFKKFGPLGMVQSLVHIEMQGILKLS